MRKKVMAFNAKVNAWIMKRLKGVWLDPIFCAIFAIMCVASIIGALHRIVDVLAAHALRAQAVIGVEDLESGGQIIVHEFTDLRQL